MIYEFIIIRKKEKETEKTNKKKGIEVEEDKKVIRRGLCYL